MIRAGGRCCRPACGIATLGPSATRSGAGQLLGEAAHIRAASPGGARYDERQSEEQRHAADNGLWLCERCASLVDKNNGADFTVADLTAWKIASECAALDRIYRLSDTVRDNCVSSLMFINVPRLRHFTALSKQAALPNLFASGIPGDRYIAPELYALEQAIGRLRFPAIHWHEGVKLIDDPTAMMVSFEGLFRTRNGPRGRHDRDDRNLSDLSLAPHIYQKADGLRLVLPYDPKYVTTSTASVEFNSGQVRVGGFAQIKGRQGTDIIASPLLIGLASTPETRAFWDAFNSH